MLKIIEVYSAEMGPNGLTLDSWRGSKILKKEKKKRRRKDIFFLNAFLAKYLTLNHT
jgi:hypothetical protein